MANELRGDQATVLSSSVETIGDQADGDISYVRERETQRLLLATRPKL